MEVYRDFNIKVKEGFEKAEILKALWNFSHASLKILIIEENHKAKAGNPEIKILARMDEQNIDKVGQIIGQAIAGIKLHEE